MRIKVCGTLKKQHLEYSNPYLLILQFSVSAFPQQSLNPTLQTSDYLRDSIRQTWMLSEVHRDHSVATISKVILVRKMTWAFKDLICQSATGRQIQHTLLFY